MLVEESPEECEWINVNFQDVTFQATMLATASCFGYLEIVKLLIEAGADVDQKERTSGSTALIGAAENDHTAVLEFLITKGADMNAVDAGGRTALMHACENGKIDSIETLIRYGADESIKTKANKDARKLCQNDKVRFWFDRALKARAIALVPPPNFKLSISSPSSSSSSTTIYPHR